MALFICDLSLERFHKVMNGDEWNHRMTCAWRLDVRPCKSAMPEQAGEEFLANSVFQRRGKQQQTMSH